MYSKSESSPGQDPLLLASVSTGGGVGCSCPQRGSLFQNCLGVFFPSLGTEYFLPGPHTHTSSPHQQCGRQGYPSRLIMIPVTTVLARKEHSRDSSCSNSDRVNKKPPKHCLAVPSQPWTTDTPEPRPLHLWLVPPVPPPLFAVSTCHGSLPPQDTPELKGSNSSRVRTHPPQPLPFRWGQGALENWAVALNSGASGQSWNRPGVPTW